VSLKALKTKLDKLPTKNNTPQIIVCWCNGERVCDYHAKHPDAPPPDKVFTVSGIDLENDI